MMLRKDKKLVFDSAAGLSLSQRISSFLVVLLAGFIFGAILSSFVLGVYFATDNLLDFFGKTSNSQPEINQTQMSKEKMHLLFVYGTLKKDCSRSSVMDSSRFLGLAKTTENYKLYDCGSYPALVESENGGVWGELYEVGPLVMVRLDQLEGVDVGLYERSNICLSEISLVTLPLHKETMDFLEKKITISYVYLHDVSSLMECGSIWIPIQSVDPKS